MSRQDDDVELFKSAEHQSVFFEQINSGEVNEKKETVVKGTAEKHHRPLHIFAGLRIHHGGYQL